MIDGILNVHKESGYTSFDVVAKLRGILKQKKIGHTGTLDPMAEGVLLVCLGKATKLVDMLTEGDKCYRAAMKLGFETDTEDITGSVVKKNETVDIAAFTEEELREHILSYVKTYDQIPPMYSAIKKNGKKLYEYAREGVEIEREKRSVTIYDIRDIQVMGDEISFVVHCSKGTYIRSLCRDIGRSLGCYATLSALTRLRVHSHDISDALTLSEIEAAVADGTIGEHVLPVDALLRDYPAYRVTESGKRYLENGNKLKKNFLVPEEQGDFDAQPQRIRVYMDESFTALYDYVEREGLYRPYKMFLS